MADYDYEFQMMKAAAEVEKERASREEMESEEREEVESDEVQYEETQRRRVGRWVGRGWREGRERVLCGFWARARRVARHCP